MVTAADLNLRTHSYRNFQPHEFLDALDESPRNKVKGALKRLESRRLYGFLDALSIMFGHLDRDEKVLFTRRNPGLVLWMNAYNEVEELVAYPELVEVAEGMLDSETGLLKEGAAVPPFERKAVRGGRTHLEDLAFRRRSYREFTPQEILEVAQVPHDVSVGLLTELGVYNPEIRAKLEGDVEISGKLAGREVIGRIESGRFKPMLKAGFKFFGPLDPDERRTFARRNPGVIMWLSAYGFTEDLIWGDQFFPFTEGIYPTLGEVSAP